MSHTLAQQCRHERAGNIARPSPRTVWKSGVGDSHEWEPFLDGMRPELCVEANVFGGWVKCLRADAAGEIEHDALTNKARTITRRGAVEIRPCAC